MLHWEYAVADFTKLENAVPELDRLGSEGWEAVGLVSTWGAGWRFVHPVVLLKRPRPEFAQPGAPAPAAVSALPAGLLARRGGGRNRQRRPPVYASRPGPGRRPADFGSSAPYRLAGVAVSLS